MKNTPRRCAKRLILRRFTEEDVDAFYQIMRDPAVNKFLPLFPPETRQEEKRYLQDKFLQSYEKPTGFRYAICRKPERRPAGYETVADDDRFDLGYGLRKTLWHKGIVTEACTEVVALLQRAGVPYITATHDVKNS